MFFYVNFFFFFCVTRSDDKYNVVTAVNEQIKTNCMRFNLKYTNLKFFFLFLKHSYDTIFLLLF